MKDINLISSDSFFKISDSFIVNTMNIFDEKVLIIDDVLCDESFCLLDESSNNYPMTLFKQTLHSMNGISFIDGRFCLKFAQNYSYINFILKMISDNFERLASWYEYITINYFKNLEVPKKPLIGNIPHGDQHEIGSLLFFDDVEGNGVAFYKMKTGQYKIHNVAENNLYMSNGFMLDYSVSDYRFFKNDYDKLFDEHLIIPSKKNRMIIYDGRLIHGAFHDESLFNSDMRKTMVTSHSFI